MAETRQPGAAQRTAGWPKPPRRITFRHRLDYAALRIVAALVRMLPIGTGAALMGFLWRAGAPFTARHQRVMANLEKAFPEKSAAERRAIAMRQWDNLGRVFAETFRIDRIAADPGRIEVAAPPELLARLETLEGGLSIVSAHMGNWEVIALPVQRYRTVSALYQRLSNPLADRYLTGLRGQVFRGGLHSKGHRTAAHIMEWVRAGNAVAMLGDAKEMRGIELSFFGMAMRANPFPAMVARRLNVPLVAAVGHRLPGSRFRVGAIEIGVPRTENPAADVAAATQAVLDYFEAEIRKEPADWMWVLDVWRQRRGRDRVEETAAGDA